MHNLPDIVKKYLLRIPSENAMCLRLVSLFLYSLTSKRIRPQVIILLSFALHDCSVTTEL